MPRRYSILWFLQTPLYAYRRARNRLPKLPRRSPTVRSGRCKAKSYLGHTHSFIVSERRQGDAGIIGEVFRDDAYRVQDIKCAPHCIFDIGAHIGAFSVLARQAFPDAAIFCFEPNPETRVLLEQNVSGLGINVIPAALHYSTKVHLVTHPSDTGWDKVEENGLGPEVDTITLEAALELAGVDTVDLVKLDCEGGEINAFERMNPETAARMGLIVGEYHCNEDVFESLAKNALPHHRVSIVPNPIVLNIGFFRAEPE